MLFTILAEFPSYREEEVLSFSPNKFRVIYLEALRVRASRYTLLSNLINSVNMVEKKRDELIGIVDRMLTPHYITEHKHDQQNVHTDWNLLRSQRHV